MQKPTSGRRSSISGMLVGLGIVSSKQDDANVELVKKLKAAVHRGTVDDGYGTGDSSGIEDINQVLQANPNLIQETVGFLKVRVNEQTPTTSCLAIDLVDQCMENNGLEFRQCVASDLLPRILSLAMPNQGNHPSVQKVASTVIHRWASLYGGDGRLAAFKNAEIDLSKKESIDPRPPTSGARRGSLVEVQNILAEGRNNSVVTVAVKVPGKGRRKSSVDLSGLSEEDLLKLSQLSQTVTI